MANIINVRFVHNFIMNITQTVLDVNGRFSVKKKDVHVRMGEVYNISQFERHNDGRVDLHFPDSSPFSGVAHNVEGDYVEIKSPEEKMEKYKANDSNRNRSGGGCGSCGKKRKK